MKENYYSLQLRIHNRFTEIANMWANPGEYSEEDLELFFEGYFKNYYAKLYKKKEEEIDILSISVNKYTKSIFIKHRTQEERGTRVFSEKFNFRYSYVQNSEHYVYDIRRTKVETCN